MRGTSAVARSEKMIKITRQRVFCQTLAKFYDNFAIFRLCLRTPLKRVGER